MDNYKTAVETADKCCQANIQFAEISEVGAISEESCSLEDGAGDAGVLM